MKTAHHQQITVGQEAVIGRTGSRSTHYHFDYKVTKVTPSGQVVVQRGSDGYERRFDAKGREIGRGNYPDTLHFNVTEIRAIEDKKARQNAAASAILAVKVENCKGTYSKETMEEQIAQLEALLVAAKAAVASI